MTTTPSQPKSRLYGDDGLSNKALLAPLREPLHTMFSRWVTTHHQSRDFVVAAEHTATALYGDYLLSGSPRFDDELPPEPVLLPLPSAIHSVAGPRTRFYNDVGELNVDGYILREHRQVLAPLFLAWSMQNLLEREFVTAVREVALELTYDYAVCRSLGGLGGGLTANQFLMQRLGVRAT